MSDPLRVIKLGGSLLDDPELPSRFRHWLAAQPEAANVVIVGGGRFVDAVRSLDQLHHLPAETSHWLAIRAMSVSAELAADLLEPNVLVTRLTQLRLSTSSPMQILDVEHFLREDDASDDHLPCGWHVTSDSIAARVASELHACELVLLKSTLPVGPWDRVALARVGYVDPYFPRAASGIAVRAVHLRGGGFPQFAMANE